MKRVFLGISGGIDSAASVLILKELGYEVVGVYLQIHTPLTDHEELQDRLGIKIIINNVSDIFNANIIDNFVNSYMMGLTPSPCVECNHSIKWKIIRQMALENGCNNWATGHYCNVSKHNGTYYIERGLDPIKDQSYYLWKLEQDILEGAIFPLGNYTKAQIYDMMREKGYQKIVNKPQSMSVCFLKDKGLKLFLEENLPTTNDLKGGDILDTDGNIIGKHDGYPFYTIAQKKGLGLNNGKCVIDIVPETNRLIVGNRNDLFTKEIIISNYYFGNLEDLSSNNIVANVRGIGENPKGFAQIKILDRNKAKISLEYPAWAVTKGQPVVFYCQNRVIGGGYAEEFSNYSI